ncbi:hypothetical protein [Desulfobulbus oligotrophicus]|uniref:Uncharacterized protein n=1 Tax=Desulfobulbus oligotrophicus TaxID=1909699 RepID=A0A7T5VC65_9BACT|nr:hypothetical protein [Desulfobulbus oligotrophicus]QQG65185.1 hypothetical protein HP555_04525 [Desulfobulbus oligotrophicus]
MHANITRASLYKAAAVLLFFVILAYLVSSTPDGGVFSSIGQMIIGVFRFIQWSIAMIIGVTLSIAVLIAIFLFAVSLTNKAAAASMYQAIRVAVIDLSQSFISRYRPTVATAETVRPEEIPTRDIPAAPVQQSPVHESSSSDTLSAQIAGDIQKMAESQQALSSQLSNLTSKLQVLEERSSDFLTAGHLETVTAELATTGKNLGALQADATVLEQKISQTLQQVTTITPEKILGNIPERLQHLETKEDAPAFDPAPLVASIEALEAAVGDLKKQKTSPAKARTTKTKKKA